MRILLQNIEMSGICTYSLQIVYGTHPSGNNLRFNQHIFEQLTGKVLRAGITKMFLIRKLP